MRSFFETLDWPIALAFASIFDYDTKAAYVELLGEWGMLMMSFYFGGRTLEKIIDMKTNKDGK